MGSFEEICSLSGLPIVPDEDIVAFIICMRSDARQGSGTLSTRYNQFYFPMSLAIEGKYDSYGGIYVSGRHDYNTSIIRERSLYDEAIWDDLHRFSQAITEGSVLLKYGKESNEAVADWFFVRKDVYRFLSKEILNGQDSVKKRHGREASKKAFEAFSKAVHDYEAFFEGSISSLDLSMLDDTQIHQQMMKYDLGVRSKVTFEPYFVKLIQNILKGHESEAEKMQSDLTDFFILRDNMHTLSLDWNPKPRGPQYKTRKPLEKFFGFLFEKSKKITDV